MTPAPNEILGAAPNPWRHRQISNWGTELALATAREAMIISGKAERYTGRRPSCNTEPKGQSNKGHNLTKFGVSRANESTDRCCECINADSITDAEE
jgi:hypothetical protein